MRVIWSVTSQSATGSDTVLFVIKDKQKQLLIYGSLSPFFTVAHFYLLIGLFCVLDEGNSNNAAGKPIHVPVVPQRNFNQKRQVDFNAGSRGKQQGTPGGVPLQQAFRPPAPSAAVNRPRPEQVERPERFEPPNSIGQRVPSSSFTPPSSSEQLFAPLRDSSNEGPARQQLAQRPQRPAAPASFGASATPNRNPEYAAGFPSGFTSGLPSFDFQGRMPGTIWEFLFIFN